MKLAIFFPSVFLAVVCVNTAEADPYGGSAVQNISSFSASRSLDMVDRADTERAQVSIRVIEATHLVDATHAPKETEVSEIVVDPRLQDLKDKFAQFPYNDFKLNAESSKFIAIRQKEPIRLMNGQRIYLRVIDYTDTESTIWLRWVSASGEVLLDTRMGVVFNDAMVVGLDQMSPDRIPSPEQKEGQGLVLAVKVSPIVTAH